MRRLTCARHFSSSAIRRFTPQNRREEIGAPGSIRTSTARILSAVPPTVGLRGLLPAPRIPANPHPRPEMAISRGLEPRSPAPQARALSIELRDRIIHQFVMAPPARGDSVSRKPRQCSVCSTTRCRLGLKCALGERGSGVQRRQRQRSRRLGLDCERRQLVTERFMGGLIKRKTQPCQQFFSRAPRQLAMHGRSAHDRDLDDMAAGRRIPRIRIEATAPKPICIPRRSPSIFAGGGAVISPFDRRISTMSRRL